MPGKALRLTVQKMNALKTLFFTTGAAFQIRSLADDVLLTFPSELSDCTKPGSILPAIAALNEYGFSDGVALVETGTFCCVAVVMLDETHFMISEPVLSSTQGSIDMRIVDSAIREERLAWYYQLLRRQPILSRYQLASFASMVKYLCMGSFAPEIHFYRGTETLNVFPHDEPHNLSYTDLHTEEETPRISESYYTGIARAIASGDRQMLELAIRIPHNGSEGVYSKDPLQQVKYEFVTRIGQTVNVAVIGGIDREYALALFEYWCREMDHMTSPMEIRNHLRYAMFALCDKVHEAAELTGYSAYTRKAIQYVRSHLFEPLTVQRVAAMIPVNRNTLSLAFKKDMHVSLQKFITEEKLKESVFLLRRENLQASDISIMLGFSSHSHFIELFKQKYGMTPTAYRHSKVLNADSD